MTSKQTILAAIFSLLCVGMISAGALLADEDAYDLAPKDLFENLRRPPVIFYHRLHEEALDVEGCGICHHGPNEETGELEYIEDEELSCRECHDREKTDVSALREAYHGSCTGCHRTLRKDPGRDSGPTTCGECHKTGAPK